MPVIGEVLREARLAQGMRQSDVEIATGVTCRRLQQMERGNNPLLDDLLAVVAYVGVDLGTVIRHPRRETPWQLR